MSITGKKGASPPWCVPAHKFTQRDVTLFSFVMSATHLLELGIVERFGESTTGVNRQYDERHALDIAEAMTTGDQTVMTDSIYGDLSHHWEFNNGKLIATGPATISIDDGQHRLGAFGVLNRDELERWSFQVVATQGMDYHSRMRVFRQQARRKPIDPRQDLAQRHELNEWRTDAERQAYELILQLNSGTTSPLRGMIILEETVRRPYERHHRPLGINANGLWRTLKSVMSKGSPLHVLSPEKRAEVILNVIRLASELWPKAWASQDHILTTARGINALLKLMVSSPEFRGAIGDDFRVESLRNGLAYAGSFSWHKSKWRNAGVEVITHQLDRYIARARVRSSSGGDVIA